MRALVISLLLPVLLLAEEVTVALRNPLGDALPDRLVVMRLADLDIAETPPIAAVAVRDEAGEAIPAQFDPFGQFPGCSSEVVVQVDLKPGQTRLLQITLQRGDEWLTPPSVPVADGAGTVTAGSVAYPFARYPHYGIRIEQPRLKAGAGAADDPDVDGMLDDLLAEPDKQETTSLGGGAKPELEPPLGEEGLPFCLLGLTDFSPQAELVAWDGPLRSTVSLIDSQATWRMAKITLSTQARQTFWFPKAEQTVYFDAYVHWAEALPRLVMTVGGIQLNSQEYDWQVTMGQHGEPPYTAPVSKILTGSRSTPYFEGYQRSSFNHRWVLATSKAGSVAAVVDRERSRLGATTHWGSGKTLLANHLSIDDPGPSGLSLSYGLRAEALPAGYAGRVHLVFPFGAEPVVVNDAWGERLTAQPVIQPVREQSYPAVERLPEAKQPLVVVPDDAAPVELWTQLADGLDAAWRRSAGALHYVNVMHPGGPAPDMLLVVVGYPGCGGLFDQLNATYGFIDPYPWSEIRQRIVLIAGNDERGPILAVAANRPEGVATAIERVLTLAPPPQPSPPLSLSQREWTSLMPHPWEGVEDETGPFRSLAFTGGHADFLLLLRAGEALRELRGEFPPAAQVHWVDWRFDSPSGPRVRPVHDAARPLLENPFPDRQPGELLGLWIRLPAETDGPQTCHLSWAGGERAFQLDVERLALPLGERALGLFPLGFSKDAIMMYFGWDDVETYYARLPALIRQARAYGVNGFAFDVAGIRLAVDAEGTPVVDVSELQREIEAVRAGGWVEYGEVHSLNEIWQRDRDVFTELVRRHGLKDDWAAWELIIPHLRAALEELGVADTLVCRHADEIPDYERWIGFAEIYKRCGFRMTCAINGYGVENHRLGVGTMGLWMPLYNFFLNRWGQPIADDAPGLFNRQFRDERLAAGERIWPYVCGPGPYAWSPRPRSQVRWLLMDVHRKGGQGLAYYGGMVWSHTLDPAYRKKQVADLFEVDATFTTLYYPDAEHNRLLPSLRAIAAQQGLEDAAALAALRHQAAEQGVDLEARLTEAFETLDMNSGQEAFDPYRRALDAMWQEVAR